MWYLFVLEVIQWLAEQKAKVCFANEKTDAGKAGLISARTKTEKSNARALPLKPKPNARKSLLRRKRNLRKNRKYCPLIIT